MAHAEEQSRLEDLMNDVNFPMPGPEDLDLDFDFDFETSKLAKAGKGVPMPRENMFDQQYGAVAALATQVCRSAPVAIRLYNVIATRYTRPTCGKGTYRRLQASSRADVNLHHSQARPV